MAANTKPLQALQNAKENLYVLVSMLAKPELTLHLLTQFHSQSPFELTVGSVIRALDHVR